MTYVSLYDHEPQPAPKIGPIDLDIPCARCGYNLRSQMIDGNCPECDLPVRRSVMGDPLHMANDTWLIGLSWGARLLVASVIATLALGLLAAIANYSTPAGPTHLGMFLAWAGLLPLGLWWLSIIMLSTPDPDRAQHAPTQPWTHIARVGVTAGLLGSLFSLVAYSGGGWLAALIGAVFRLGNPPCLFAMCMIVTDLAQRLPDPDMARRMGFIRWPLAVTAVLLGLAEVLSAAAGHTNGVAAAYSTVTAGCLMFFVSFAYIALGLVCVHQMIHFAQCVDSARARKLLSGDGPRTTPDDRSQLQKPPPS